MVKASAGVAIATARKAWRNAGELQSRFARSGCSRRWREAGGVPSNAGAWQEVRRHRERIGDPQALDDLLGDRAHDIGVRQRRRICCHRRDRALDLPVRPAAVGRRWLARTQAAVGRSRRSSRSATARWRASARSQRIAECDQRAEQLIGRLQSGSDACRARSLGAAARPQRVHARFRAPSRSPRARRANAPGRARPTRPRQCRRRAAGRADPRRPPTGCDTHLPRRGAPAGTGGRARSPWSAASAHNPPPMNAAASGQVARLRAMRDRAPEPPRRSAGRRPAAPTGRRCGRMWCRTARTCRAATPPQSHHRAASPTPAVIRPPSQHEAEQHGNTPTDLPTWIAHAGKQGRQGGLAERLPMQVLVEGDDDGDGQRRAKRLRPG